MSRLHMVAWLGCLLKNAARLKIAYVSRIAYHYLQSRLLKQVAGILKCLFAHVGYGYGFAVVGVYIKAVFNADARHHHHHYHCAQIANEVAAFEFPEEIR